jgi:predicted AAA+ superfamily ATPase
MKISKDELISVLSQFNPWWRGETIPDLPEWKRASFNELSNWVYNPPTPRAVLLSGARQVGKTTLLLQVINSLLKEQGIPSANILYATFDHPLMKMVGVDLVLEAWRERMPKLQGEEYIFLDEAQFVRDFGTWVKHQVDFSKYRRIIFTGSAMPLIHKNQESGVGRWHTIRLTTLSFYEYLQLKKAQNLKKYSEISIIIESLTEKKYFEKLNNEVSLKIKFPTQGYISYSERQPPESAPVANQKLFETIKADLFSKLVKNNDATLLLPSLPPLKSLQDLFDWPQQEFYRVAEIAEPYLGHFNQYLVRGGFPQTALVESITQAQRLLREDIIDKVLKRDMTALFGVRRVVELEQTFLYLCMHDGGLLDMQQLCGNLGVKRPTAQNFIDLLEATHLIYRLQPFGYGKEILRAKFKIYLADPAIASAVLLKGDGILESAQDLGVATETAVFKHLFARYYPKSVRFTYWRGNKDHEVDLIAETGNQRIPFEIKYRAKKTGSRELKGLMEFCNKESNKYAYVITKSLKDFGLLKDNPSTDTKIMQIPAALLCYWMGESELSQTNSLD